MKFRVLNIAFMFALVVSGSLLFPAGMRAQTDSPETVIKTFYNGYVRPSGKNAEPLGKNSPLRKYLSAQLTAKKIKAFERENEADYFVQSQEWSDEWENKFTVSKAVIKGGTATVFVTFPQDYPRVKVTLKKEAGAWKIYQVQNANK
ncbi:MAG TPA: DUF3828 domain-containing protein [Pyrinomonadaceae bacterium]|nr:DUF3828 domain-containing protein [Pyrinomonadaceae bacterium]